jgi:hypothetical protein
MAPPGRPRPEIASRDHPPLQTVGGHCSRRTIPRLESFVPPSGG